MGHQHRQQQGADKKGGSHPDGDFGEDVRGAGAEHGFGHATAKRGSESFRAGALEENDADEQETAQHQNGGDGVNEYIHDVHR